MYLTECLAQLGNRKDVMSSSLCNHDVALIPISSLNDDQSLRADRYLSAQGMHRPVGEDDEYELTHRRVCSDMSILDAINKILGNHKKPTEISHWADFDNQADATKFVAWIKSKGYRVKPSAYSSDSKKVLVKFAHKGALKQQAICSRTIALDAKAAFMGGSYDGWEVCFGCVRIGATLQHPSMRLTA